MWVRNPVERSTASVDFPLRRSASHAFGSAGFSLVRFEDASEARASHEPLAAAGRSGRDSGAGSLAEFLEEAIEGRGEAVLLEVSLRHDCCIDSAK